MRTLSHAKKGYNASLEYFQSLLQSQTKLRVWVQPFTVSELVYTSALFTQESPVSATYIQGKDFSVIQGSSAGTVASAVVAIIGTWET